MLLFMAQAIAGEDLVSRLAWMSGCWALEGRDSGSTETLMAPAGGTMLGMSRTVKAGRTLEYEFMRIHADPKGTGLLFTAQPSGQRETTFASRSIAPGEVTFENPDHDFPQRIIYRRLAEGSMLGRIEGIRAGSLRAVDFPMKRQACGTGQP